MFAVLTPPHSLKPYQSRVSAERLEAPRLRRHSTSTSPSPPSANGGRAGQRQRPGDRSCCCCCGSAQAAAAAAAAQVEEHRRLEEEPRVDTERRRPQILPTDFGPEGMPLPLLSLTLFDLLHSRYDRKQEGVWVQ